MDSPTKLYVAFGPKQSVIIGGGETGVVLLPDATPVAGGCGCAVAGSVVVF